MHTLWSSAALRVMQALSLILTAALSLIPKRKRLGGYICLAWLLQPLCRWMGHANYLKSIDSRQALMLYHILAFVSARRQFEYDIQPRQVGLHNLLSARDASRGVMIIGVHTMLIHIVLRSLYDHGFDPNIIALETHRVIFGTNVIPRYIGTNSASIIHVQNALAACETVIGLCDNRKHRRDAYPTDLGNGKFWLWPALSKTAIRTHANIVFVKPALIAGRLYIFWGTPPKPRSDHNAVLKSFEEFLRH